MSIPKVIHYCWFGPDKLPRKAEKCIQSWKRFCPDYEIVQWDESNFDVDANEYTREACRAGKWALATDYIRLWVIYHYGGIYLDVDVELLTGLNDLLNCSGFISFEDDQQVNTGSGFGAAAGDPFVKRMLDAYTGLKYENAEAGGIIPCPVRNTKALAAAGLLPNGLEQWLGDRSFHVLPRDYMNPLCYDSRKTFFTEHTVSVHHFNGSWHTPKERFWKNFRKIFGQNFYTLVRFKGLGKIKRLIKK